MISGVPTSIAALLGKAERGPIAPCRVKSLAEFHRKYGASLSGGTLPDAVTGFFANGGRDLFICRIVSATSATAACGLLPVAAVGPGNWGNRLFAQLSGGAMNGSFNLRIAYFTTAADDLQNPFSDSATLSKAQLVETFSDLETTHPSSSEHWRRRLEASVLIRPVAGDFALDFAEARSERLTGGSDGGEILPMDFEGTGEIGNETGLAALASSRYDDVSLVAAPGATDPVLTMLCEHCEKHPSRFAVLDGPSDIANVLDLNPRTQWESSHAAYYIPWLHIPGGQGGSRPVPPSGHVLGIIVRTDLNRGVWKAPANEPVAGINGLQVHLTTAQQEVLNPRGVNIIREFPVRGIRVWGARTLSSEAEDKYISVQRLMSWIRRSIDEGTRWATFEMQGEALWSRMRAEVEIFLHAQWRAGALFGRKAEDAYFVKCDGTTMTEDDIQSGQLICEVGIAVVRPAEFVILRISHRVAGN